MLNIIDGAQRSERERRLINPRAVDMLTGFFAGSPLLNLIGRKDEASKDLRHNQLRLLHAFVSDIAIKLYNSQADIVTEEANAIFENALEIAAETKAREELKLPPPYLAQLAQQKPLDEQIGRQLNTKKSAYRQDLIEEALHLGIITAPIVMQIEKSLDALPVPA